MNPNKTNIRNDLILKHIYIVHHIVQKFQKNIGPIWGVEDLISIGTIGLINAVDNYNPTKGAKLSTYARRKVYGAIVDYLRQEDHLSRSVRTQKKDTDKAITYLEHELGRESDTHEQAQHLNQNIDKYHKQLNKTQSIQSASVDAPQEEDTSLIHLEHDVFYIQDNILITQQFVQHFEQILLNLPERERVVFTLYYYEGLNMREIGEFFDVGEGRISQLLHKSLQIILEVSNAET